MPEETIYCHREGKRFPREDFDLSEEGVWIHQRNVKKPHYEAGPLVNKDEIPSASAEAEAVEIIEDE